MSNYPGQIFSTSADDADMVVSVSIAEDGVRVETTLHDSAGSILRIMSALMSEADALKLADALATHLRPL